MNLRNKLLILILSICIISLFPTELYAATYTQSDLTQTSGSVSVRIQDKKKAVSGGSLLLYQVAKLEENTDAISLVYCDEYASCDIDLETDNMKKLAEDLLAYTTKEKIKGQNLKINKKGFAKAKEIPLGLYLIAQDQPAKGYEAIGAFVVMIPYEEDGQLAYDLNASPKVEIKQKETPKETEPEHDPPGRLPKTGQLWWPVMLLASAGLLFFVIGWLRRN